MPYASACIGSSMLQPNRLKRRKNARIANRIEAAECDQHDRYKPPMTHDNRLAGEGIRTEGSQKQRGLGHVVDRRKFAVHGFFQHDILDDLLFRDAEFLGLLRYLLVDQRGADEAGADYIGADTVRSAFLGDNFR